MASPVVLRPGGLGVPIGCGVAGSTVQNSGPSTVYYRDEFPVDSTTNDGSIASGGSAVLFGAQFVNITAGNAAVELVPTQTNANSRVMKPPTLVPFGDSFSARTAMVTGSGANRYEPRDSWLAWLQARLRQRFTVLGNAGASGETTTQEIARLASVLNLAPAWVVWATPGTNDLPAGTAPAATIANVAYGVNTLTAANINVVLTTVPPRASPNALTTGQEANRLVVNRGLVALARATPGVVLADTALAVSQADGTPRTSALEDGLHLATTGAMLFGRAIANAVTAFVPSVDDLVTSNVDTGSLLTNGMMTGTAGTKFASTVTPTGSVADSWILRTTAAAGGVVGSKVARTDGISGEWQQAALTGASAAQVLLYINTDIPVATLPVGTQVYAQAEIEIDTATVTNLTGVELQIFNNPSNEIGGALSVNHGHSGDTASFSDGLPSSMLLKTPTFTIPSGSTSTRVRLIATADAITFRVGRVELRVAGT